MITGKIGVEIECIVNDDKYQVLYQICQQNHWTLKNDGSVSVNNRNSNTERGVEFTLGPYSFTDIPLMLEKIDIALTQVAYVNNTCGLHFHLSFDDISVYYKLLNWNFAQAFQNTIKEKFKTKLELGRLQNRFCVQYKDETDFKEHTNKQLNSYYKDDRYFSINYNAYNIHKTIEFRIFAPTMKVKKINGYINLLLNSITAHINTTAFKSIKINLNKSNNTHRALIIREVINTQGNSNA